MTYRDRVAMSQTDIHGETELSIERGDSMVVLKIVRDDDEFGLTECRYEFTAFNQEELLLLSDVLLEYAGPLGVP